MAMRRLLRSSRLLVLAAALVALASGPVANATFNAPAEVTGPAFNYDGSLVVDANDDEHLAYVRYGRDPGIMLAKSSAGTWSPGTRVTDGNDSSPSMTVDGAGHHRIAFARSGGASDQGIWYATDATGSWVVSRVTTDPAEGPSMAEDPAGHLHIVYVSNGFSPGTYHVTDATGSWVSERIAAGHLHDRPEIAISATGELHVAVASLAPETRGIYEYRKSGTSAWVASRVTTNYDIAPSIALDANGKSHVSFERYANGSRGLDYATNAGGSWATQQVIALTGDDQWVSDSTIRIKPGGDFAIGVGFQIGGTSINGIYVFTYSGGWSGQLIAGAEFPAVSDLRYGSDGPHLAVTEWAPTPGVYVATTSVVTPFQQVATSTYDDAVRLRRDANGHQHVAFQRTSGDLIGDTDFDPGRHQCEWTLDLRDGGDGARRPRHGAGRNRQVACRLSVGRLDRVCDGCRRDVGIRDRRR